MTSRLPPLESLRMLEACVRHENMTRAANELGVTAAAVSLRIRNLETELGTTLFIRRGPRIAATGTATRLAARIGAVVAELRGAVDASRAASPRITVTAVPTLASRWLARALTDYQLVAPTAQIVVDSTEALRPSGTFDISLRCGSDGHWKGLSAQRIFDGDATPMVAPFVAAQISNRTDLAQLPLVPDTRWTRWFAKFEVAIGELRFTADYPSQELAATAVAAGAGAALLSPGLFAALLIEGKLVRPFSDMVEGGPSYFVAISDHEQRTAVLNLRDFLVAHARCTQLQGWFSGKQPDGSRDGIWDGASLDAQKSRLFSAAHMS